MPLKDSTKIKVLFVCYARKKKFRKVIFLKIELFFYI